MNTFDIVKGSKQKITPTLPQYPRKAPKKLDYHPVFWLVITRVKLGRRVLLEILTQTKIKIKQLYHQEQTKSHYNSLGFSFH